MRFLTPTCLKTTSNNFTTISTRHTINTTIVHSQSYFSNSQHFLHLLDQITTLKQFKQIHAHITTSGLRHNQFVTGKLIEISATKLNHKTNNMTYPILIFNHSEHKNQFTWNTIIRGFSLSHTPYHALSVFVEMCRESVAPQGFTFAFVLKGCARSHAFESGKSVHCVVMKSGYGKDLFVANTAIHVYTSCGDLWAAEKVFDEMGERNVVTWNAVISGYVQNRLPDDGLRVFDQMRLEAVRPNDVTMISVISACSQKEDLKLGTRAHAYVDENWAEFEFNVNVGTALIDMYGKCKQMGSARRVFNGIHKRDIGVWNALINGYVTNACFKEALEVFGELQANGLDPDEPTLVSTLCACGHLGALDIGKKIQLYAEERNLVSNVTVGTALVDMYAKCGCITEAREVFNKMSERDVMTWTAMIGGFALHGHAKDALDLFKLMLNIGPRPDGITFVGVLCACSHAGLVEEGLNYFASMQHDYNIIPKIEHYGCMIDLLGRAGRLEEAHGMIRSMKIQPNAIVWRALLSACRLHSNIELAESSVENLFKLQSDNCGDYVLLSNLYASKDRWDDVKNIRNKMDERGITKLPGFSLFETISRKEVGNDGAK